jgi:pyridoxal phosphate enzyme (YggS family)
VSIEENLTVIRSRIQVACDLVGRDPASVTLIAASKNQPLQKLEEAYSLGLRDFGESRLQEAEAKVEAMPGDITWHFIGTLQSNKAKKIAGLFSVIHTLEKESQLREIDKSGRQIDVLQEVNIADEPQKSGNTVNILDDFRKQVLNYSTVRYRGLMTIGPAVSDPEMMRPFFRLMKRINDEAGGDWLSMGMSDDFDVAVQEGSTHIRVGTALFGERERNT